MSVSKSSKKVNVKKPLKVVVQSLADVHIHASFNNTIVTFCNQLGDAFAWSTSGKMGFKGAKKSTPYASKCSAEDSARTAWSLGVRKVNVFVSGPGLGRESAIRAIQAYGVDVESITDVTPVPHNGCRPPKRRRP